MFKLRRTHTKPDRSDPGTSDFSDLTPVADRPKPDSLKEFRESLAQMIVQDLKDPITVIQGSLLYILEEVQENAGYFTDKSERALQTALLHCKRQLNMINDLLDISQLDPRRVPLRKGEIDFSALVDAAIAALDPALRKQDVTVQKSVPGGLPPLALDAAVIQRVIVNLLSNSLKFSRPGSRIRVSAALSEDGWLECAVEDNGLAVPAEDLDRIFDRDFHGDALGRFRKGQGFAFAFCRLAVEAHGGHIWADRGPGQSNRFVFTLPLSPA